MLPLQPKVNEDPYRGPPRQGPEGSAGAVL